MNKEELIGYISACVDAEQGVYETSRLIDNLDSKIYELKGRDYNSEELIPKPKMEAIQFNEPKPRLKLKHDEKLEKEINDLGKDYSVKYYSNSYYKGEITKYSIILLGLIALCALALWGIALDPVWMFINDFIESHFLLFLIITVVLLVVGIIIRDDHPAVAVCFIIPLAWFAVCGVLTFVTDLLKTTDRFQLCFYFFPIILCIFGCLIIFVIKKISYTNEYERKNKAKASRYQQLKSEQDAIDEKNALLTEEHNKKLAEYEKRKEQAIKLKTRNNNEKKEQYAMTVRNAVLVDSLTANTLTAEKKKQVARKAEFEKKRNELYSKNIIHERFRNTVALIQIREYLEMGVADKLEGPDGAYRVYLDDLRTEKIIGSVDSLRSTIEAGITILAHGQEALYKEMIMANANLITLSYDLDRNLKKINHSISDMKFDLEDAIKEEGYKNRDTLSSSINRVIDYSNMINESNREAYSAQLKEIVNSQKRLLDTVEKSSYNQYLVQKKENIDNYLYSSLQDPR